MGKKWKEWNTLFLGAPKIKSDTVSTVSPSISYEVIGLDMIIFVFWMLSFKPTFSFPSFTFIKSLFSSSVSAVRVVSSAYLRLLTFPPAILIPVCASSSPTFHMMYSAYELNKPWHTPFPIWNQSVFPCPVLTVASWPTYRFRWRQVRWSGIPISLRIFQFVVIHTIKGFGILSKAQVDVFLEFSYFFYDPTEVGNLISGSSAFSKSSLYIWNFSYWWSLAWRILSITLLACEISAIVW